MLGWLKRSSSNRSSAELAPPPSDSETLIVANPHAGGFSKARLDAARTQLEARFGVSRCVITPTEQDAHRAVQAALTRGAHRIVGVGGDGTLNHLLNAVSGHRAIQIGVVPLGTANDLSGAHQSSGKQQGCLDLICVNGRRFVTVGGLGLPADVALQVNQLRGAPAQRSLRRVLGRWIYPAAAAWQILRRGKPLQMRLTYQCPTQGEKRFEGCVALMLVCNLGSLGGTLHASLESSPDDGVFELVLVPEQGRRQLLFTLLSMIRGNINSSLVLRLRATQANIEVTEPRWFFGDGELFTRDTHFELRLAPEKQEFLFLAPV